MFRPGKRPFSGKIPPFSGEIFAFNAQNRHNPPLFGGKRKTCTFHPEHGFFRQPPSGAEKAFRPPGKLPDTTNSAGGNGFFDRKDPAFQNAGSEPLFLSSAPCRPWSLFSLSRAAKTPLAAPVSSFASSFRQHTIDFMSQRRMPFRTARIFAETAHAFFL